MLLSLFNRAYSQLSDPETAQYAKQRQNNDDINIQHFRFIFFIMYDVRYFKNGASIQLILLGTNDVTNKIIVHVCWNKMLSSVKAQKGWPL